MAVVIIIWKFVLEVLPKDCFIFVFFAFGISYCDNPSLIKLLSLTKIGPSVLNDILSSCLLQI